MAKYELGLHSSSNNLFHNSSDASSHFGTDTYTANTRALVPKHKWKEVSLSPFFPSMFPVLGLVVFRKSHSPKGLTVTL